MTERKLASIRRVKEIVPIEGADMIELALVDGWQCVVKKGEFKPDDLAIYCEIDSFLPIHPAYEFLRKGCYRKLGDVEGFRIKTVKLRGQLSQGLLLPWTTFDVSGYGSLIEGTDVTEQLGIIKWDPPVPACLAGKILGNFPSFIPKTDQERVQNLSQHVLKEYVYGQQFEVTYKLDGSSCTVYHRDGHVGVCSRNLEIEAGDVNNTFVRATLQLQEYLKTAGVNIAFQGEVVGPGIQGNPHGLTEAKFFCYDVYRIDDSQHALEAYRKIVCSAAGLEHVPVLFNNLEPLEGCDFLKMAEVSCPLSGAAHSEGLVFKRTDGKFSFKVINNNYLLGEK